MAVRYRIDGMLKEVMVLPKAVGVPLVSRIKIMSQMDIADRLRPQGGRARVSINGARVDLRVSTLPASHGEKVVIRILDSRAALRSVLRQDPDVVLIGEIRDRETAAIAIQASLTGHLVFATLHTNDACSSIIRLTDLGVDPVKLAGALKGVVAQRLIRRLCRSCS